MNQYNKIWEKLGVYVHQSCYVDENVIIKDGSKIWHYSHISDGAYIGKNCTIGQNCYIGPNVVIGDGCKIQNNVSIFTGVIVHKNVFIGPSVVFTNVINPRAFIDRKQEFKMTFVECGSTIGANSTIICGNRIGEYSFVGAGSVVTKDVPDHAVVYGNPAKLRGYICECGKQMASDFLSICCECML